MDDDETSMVISEKEASMRRVWWKGMVIDARFVPFCFFLVNPLFGGNTLDVKHMPL